MMSASQLHIHSHSVLWACSYLGTLLQTSCSQENVFIISHQELPIQKVLVHLTPNIKSCTGTWWPPHLGRSGAEPIWPLPSPTVIQLCSGGTWSCGFKPGRSRSTDIPSCFREYLQHSCYILSLCLRVNLKLLGLILSQISEAQLAISMSELLLWSPPQQSHLIATFTTMGLNNTLAGFWVCPLLRWN